MAIAFVSVTMKTFLLAFVAACSLTALVGCADNDRQTTTTSYESSSVDTKEMHPVHHQQGQ